MRAARARADASSDAPREHFDWPLFLIAAALAVIGVINLYSATSVVARVARPRSTSSRSTGSSRGGILGDARRRRSTTGTSSASATRSTRSASCCSLLVFVLGRDIRGSSRWIYIGIFSFQPSEFMKLFLDHRAREVPPRRSEERGAQRCRISSIPARHRRAAARSSFASPISAPRSSCSSSSRSICALTRIQMAEPRRRSSSSARLRRSADVGATSSRSTRSSASARVLEPRGRTSSAPTGTRTTRASRSATAAARRKASCAARRTSSCSCPSSTRDFPFPVFAEDWGFVGCARPRRALRRSSCSGAIRVAATAKDRFGAVLAVGVGALIFWHAFFNLGMVTGLLPVVGVTLPLFSYGGSSVMTVMIGFGLVDERVDAKASARSADFDHAITAPSASALAAMSAATLREADPGKSAAASDAASVAAAAASMPRPKPKCATAAIPATPTRRTSS